LLLFECITPWDLRWRAAKATTMTNTFAHHVPTRLALLLQLLPVCLLHCSMHA
jgi:hypothetical protein